MTYKENNNIKAGRIKTPFLTPLRIKDQNYRLVVFDVTGKQVFETAHKGQEGLNDEQVVFLVKMINAL